MTTGFENDKRVAAPMTTIEEKSQSFDMKNGATQDAFVVCLSI
jgi:hypothetical protein